MSILKSKHFILIIISLLSLASCHKEKDEEQVYLIRLYRNNAALMEHYYDYRDRMIKSVFYGDNDTNQYTYHYASDTLSFIIHKNISSASEDTIIFKYQWGSYAFSSLYHYINLNNKKELTYINYQKLLDNFSCSYSFSYSDSGNIYYRYCSFTGGSHNSQYKYSKVINPLKKFRLVPWQQGIEESLLLSAKIPLEISLSGNNYSCIDSSCQASYSGKFTYEITTNSFNYPVQIIEKNSLNNILTTYTYEYLKL